MKKIILLFILFPILFSCIDQKNNKTKLFEKLDSNISNIDFSNILVETDSLNYFNFGYMYMGGGVAAGDINNDGLIDLYFTGNAVSNKLYLNKGDLQFEDITEKAGVAGDSRWFTGVTMADVNNDGLLDIYCSVGGKYGPKNNVLFINNGDLTFTEKAEEFGLDNEGNSIQSTFFDYDLDGDLDVYIANYPPTQFSAPNSFYAFKMNNSNDEETDRLYKNENGKFIDVTDQANLRSFGLSNSATVGDVNNDGWPDLYVSNDFSVPDYFYINNQDGTFTQRTQQITDQTSLYGMGVDIADFNNDLLLDILQMDMTPGDNRRSKANMASMNPKLFWGTVNIGFGYQYMINMLQMNNGIVNDSLVDFSNVSRLSGISTTDWSWGPLLADLDNDGFKDVFISNGTRREINNKDYFNDLKKKKYTKEDFLELSLAIPSEKIDNFVYRNKGDLTFEKMNEDWGLTYEGWTNGCTYADLDNDGDLEVILNNIDDKAVIFKNSNSVNNNYLAIKLKGAKENQKGIGARVIIEHDSIQQLQEMTLTRGFQSSVSTRFNFGLGKSEAVDKVTVIWPNQKKQVLVNVKANQILEVDIKNAVSDEEKLITQSKKLFENVSDSLTVPHHKHKENLYDDFYDQVLLPHRISQFGPNVAVADLNGDGIEDFVVGGASNYETGLYFQSKSGFLKQSNSDMFSDRRSEDMGILIFDAEGDGDNDIYIVSGGGSEFEPDSEYLQDRLYINDGNGRFSKAQDALPKMIVSGGRAHSFDFDKDGDLDLFIGGRVAPKNYPQPVNSYLLENVSENGEVKFIDVTKKIAPEFLNLGMVTDASWIDYDSDGWTDIVITGEWMPLTVFKNNEGTFVNVTNNVGLADATGWWFSLEQGDFDQDGDIDFIAGNLGLNYKYQASADQTFDVYVNDFDENNSNDIVLSYFNDGEKFPVRGRQCSSEQIPAIKSKFKNYDQFATATLVDVYTEESLKESLHYQAKTFATSYIENKDGKFIVHQLPNLAQLSSVNQIIVDDFNDDNNLDVIIAGNLYSSEVETPRNDAGKGLYLEGDGKGNFNPIEGYNSGLYINGDVKDLARIKIQDQNYIIAAKNDDYLQFIKVN